MENNVALSDFLNGYTSVFLYSRYSFCSYSVGVAQKTVTFAQKTMLCQQKKYFTQKLPCTPKLCESQKNMLWQQKKYVTHVE